MANTKKAPVEKVETVDTVAEAVEKKEPAKKTTAKKTAEKKTAEKKTTEKKAAKTAAKSTKSTKTADKKTPAKKSPKAKQTTLDDVVALAKTKANSANTTKVTKKIACTINVSGAVQGDFYIMLDVGEVISVEPYKYDDADISLWGSADDIIAVLTNKIKLIDAISSGKIGLWGNAEKAVIFVDAIF